MSIATKTGDNGTTGLLFNRRVPKNHPRVEAYGSCDELNSTIGQARALLNTPPNHSIKKQMSHQLHKIQKDLIPIMGELALLPKDRNRYLKTGRSWITTKEVQHLTQWIHELESKKIQFKGWATPGNTLTSAALDIARTTCRRAERRIYSLGEIVRKKNPAIIQYLNRLSDLLWLMARKAETESF